MQVFATLLWQSQPLPAAVMVLNIAVLLLIRGVEKLIVVITVELSPLNKTGLLCLEPLFIQVLLIEAVLFPIPGYSISITAQKLRQRISRLIVEHDW